MRIGRRGRQGETPRRDPARSEAERINAIAHDADVSVEEVLRDVAEFRLALETDMIVAAAAAEHEQPELLSEIVDGERAELADFHDRLLERLVDAAAQDELAARRARRRTPSGVSKYVAAAAAILAVLGVARTAPDAASDNRLALATASQQYADLSSAVTTASESAVKEAADELHETLESLINEHAADPEVAQQAAALLQAEISLLQVKDPAGASVVIAQARNLMTLLRRATPPNVRASVAPILDAVHSPSPSPTVSPKPKPTASPTRSTPSPTPTPTPKSSASQSQDPNQNENPLTQRP